MNRVLTPLVLTLTLAVWLVTGCSSPTTSSSTSSTAVSEFASSYVSTKYSTSTAAVTASDANPATWGALNCHDPDIFQDTDGTYYVFSTDASYGGVWGGGIQVRKSTDLVNWTCLSSPAITVWDQEMLNWCGFSATYASGGTATTPYTWAPCVVKLNGKYYMYHGVITTLAGQIRAWIGLAIADSVTGPYIPAASYNSTTYPTSTVVRYTWTATTGTITAGSLNVSGGSYNTGYGAIDPSLTYDTSGNLWMSYGSWKGGIAILQLDASTGLPTVGAPADLYSGGVGTQIAGGNGAAYEGSCVVNLSGSSYYYLLMCSGNVTSDYSVRIGRCLKSSGINGSYVDSQGNSLTGVTSTKGTSTNFHLYGNKLMGSSAFSGEYGWRAPGGPSLLVNASDGRMFLAVHTRTNFLASYYFYLQIHQLYLTSDGWLVVNPNEYYDESLTTIPASSFVGTYDSIYTVRSSTYGSFTEDGGTVDSSVDLADANETTSKSIIFNADGSIGGSYTGTWALSGGYNLTLTLKDSSGTTLGTYIGVVTNAVDWARIGTSVTRRTISFTTFCASTGEYFYGNLHNF